MISWQGWQGQVDDEARWYIAGDIGKYGSYRKFDRLPSEAEILDACRAIVGDISKKLDDERWQLSRQFDAVVALHGRVIRSEYGGDPTWKPSPKCQDCGRIGPDVGWRADGYTLCDRCNLVHRDGLPDGYTRYTVHGLDVWGNAEDGYDVNNVYPSQGTIDLPDNASTQDITAQLQQAGYVRDDINVELVEVNGDYDLYIDYDGRPELELRVQS